MFKLLAFLTDKKYWLLHSLMIKMILRLKGIKVGRRFYIEGIPQLKIHGLPENIIIGDNVTILGDIDLRNRENGKIIIKNDVTVERDCRFVSAREGKIEIGENSIVTAWAILNGGSDIIIGRNCIIGPRSSINANEHKFARRLPVREQGFIHAPVYIEDDCWIATNVAINKGVRLAKGSVVASYSVVTKDTAPFSINAGIPSKKISERN